MIMSTADKIREEIEQLGVEAVSPGMAAVAIKLAEALDSTDAPTSQAVVARELGAAMKVLRANAPIGEEGDAVDDLAARREKRRGA
ncbi:hypothetical protein HRW15_05210 [Streptomyces lunaelactis]|nr:hypothetical protein [Streptomyces lunaelactis]